MRLMCEYLGGGCARHAGPRLRPAPGSWARARHQGSRAGAWKVSREAPGSAQWQQGVGGALTVHVCPAKTPWHVWGSDSHSSENASKPGDAGHAGQERRGCSSRGPARSVTVARGSVHPPRRGRASLGHLRPALRSRCRDAGTGVWAQIASPRSRGKRPSTCAQFGQPHRTPGLKQTPRQLPPVGKGCCSLTRC